MIFIRINELLGNRDEVIANCRLAMGVLSDHTEIDVKIAELRREIDVIARQSRKAIHENASVAQNQKKFTQLHDKYMERHRIVMERIAELEDMKRERQNRRLELNRLIFELASRPLVIDAFDEQLWMVAIERVTVGVDGGMVFGFKGVEV